MTNTDIKTLVNGLDEFLKELEKLQIQLQTPVKPEPAYERVKKFFVCTLHETPYAAGIYNTRNLVGDEMKTVASWKDGLQIDYAVDWDYYEVFGLSTEDFERLKKWYEKVQPIVQRGVESIQDAIKEID